MSPKAICSSPVGLTGVLFKALFEFFSSVHPEENKENMKIFGLSFLRVIKEVFFFFLIIM